MDHVEIARRHKVALIEDCAQAHLTRKGKVIGTIGEMARSPPGLPSTCSAATVVSRSRATTSWGSTLPCSWTRASRSKVPAALSLHRAVLPLHDRGSAAVLFSVRRLPEIGEPRRQLGELLRRSRMYPGITPPGRVEGAEHSYWSFPILVTSRCWGVTPAAFGEAVTAEGIPVGGNWIGKPLYLFEGLRSRSPWSITVPVALRAGHPVEYGPGLCPRAELAMAQLRTLPIDERFAEEDVEDMARAVRRGVCSAGMMGQVEARPAL